MLEQQLKSCVSASLVFLKTWYDWLTAKYITTREFKNLNIFRKKWLRISSPVLDTIMLEMQPKLSNWLFALSKIFEIIFQKKLTFLHTGFSSDLLVLTQSMFHERITISTHCIMKYLYNKSFRVLRILVGNFLLEKLDDTFDY